MKFFFLFLCFIVNLTPAFGQNLSNETVKILEMGAVSDVQAGQPIILLPQKQTTEEEFIPLDTTWQPEQSYVKIKTLLGDSLQVPNITHIPYFFTYIQVLSDASVVVTERFSLILAEQSQTPFFRSYLKNVSDVQNKKHSLDLEILSARYNGVSVLPLVGYGNETLSVDLFNRGALLSGLHSFEFTYLIKNALSRQGNISRLFLSVLGLDIPFLIDNFQALVIYPENTKIYQANAVFGVNNQVVQDAYSVYMNELGHLFFKINGIIPQKADVRLDILTDTKGFSSQMISEKISDGVYKNKCWIICVICILVTFVYFKLTAFELKDKFSQNRYLAFIRSKLTYDLGIMSWLLYRRVDSDLVFAYLLLLIQKGVLDIQIDSQNKIILMKKKTSSVKDKKILSLFFRPCLKQIKLSDVHMSVSKLKKFINKELLFQKLSILSREILWGGVFVALSMFALLYLQQDNNKIFISFVVMFLAYFTFVIYFINQVCLNKELKKLFKDYILLPKTPEKNTVMELVCGRKKIKNSDTVFVNGKNIPFSVLSELFYKQFDLRRK